MVPARPAVGRRRPASVRILTYLAGAAAMMMALSTGMSAQRRYGAGLPAATSSFGFNGKYDGRFRFARLEYDCTNFDYGPSRYGCHYYRGLPSWEHGYPLSEQNLMQIVNALTSLQPHTEDSEVLRMDDPELLKYPVAYMTEASFWTTNDKEAAALAAYLKKGGFLICDDFRDDTWRGSGGWAA